MNQVATPSRAETLDDILESIGKTYRTGFQPLNVDDRNLEALTILNMPEHLDGLIARNAIRDPLRDLPLWAKVWPASFVLGRFLRKFEPEGKTMLELAAGTGICGLVASRYGFSRIMITDISSDALAFAKANILRNNLQDIMKVARLDLSAPRPACPMEKPDFIVASEALYLDELHRPVLKFVDRYLAAGGKAFFCTDYARQKPGFQKLAKKMFNVSEGKIGVKSSDENGEEQRRIYNILILERK